MMQTTYKFFIHQVKGYRNQFIILFGIILTGESCSRNLETEKEIEQKSERKKREYEEIESKRKEREREENENIKGVFDGIERTRIEKRKKIEKEEREREKESVLIEIEIEIEIGREREQREREQREREQREREQRERARREAAQARIERERAIEILRRLTGQTEIERGTRPARVARELVKIAIERTEHDGNIEKFNIKEVNNTPNGGCVVCSSREEEVWYKLKCCMPTDSSCEASYIDESCLQGILMSTDPDSVEFLEDLQLAKCPRCSCKFTNPDWHSFP